jgi:hypothetical protein
MKTKSILQKTDNSKTVAISVRIPTVLHERLRKIQDTARLNEMRFPVSSVIADALSNAINIAEIEISRTENNENRFLKNSQDYLEKSVV